MKNKFCTFRQYNFHSQERMILEIVIAIFAMLSVIQTVLLIILYRKNVHHEEEIAKLQSQNAHKHTIQTPTTPISVISPVITSSVISSASPNNQEVESENLK